MADVKKLDELLVSLYVSNLESRDPDPVLVKEAREYLKQMKFEAQAVPGSQVEKVQRAVDEFPKFG